MSNKILITIIILLSGVFVMLVAFVITKQFGGQIYPSSALPSNSISSNQNNPSPSTGLKVDSIIESDPNQAISDRILAGRLSGLVKQAIDQDQRYLVNTYAGIIKEVDSSEKNINNVTYKFSFRIEGGNNSSMGFALSDKDMQIAKVLSSRDGTNLPAAFADLKAGQQVRVEETLDISKRLIDSRVGFTIQIL